MDIGLSLSFPTHDSGWFRKIAIMALIGLIPILGQIVQIGWGLQILRRTIQDPDGVTLPEPDLNSQLRDGFKGFLIGIGYSLPVLAVQLPLQVLTDMIESSGPHTDISALVLFSLCLSLISMVISLAISLMMPAAYGQLVATGDISAAFDIGTVLAQVRSNIGAFLLAMVVSFLAWLLACVGLLACFVGILFTMVYAQAVVFHFYGQLYRETA